MSSLVVLCNITLADPIILSNNRFSAQTQGLAPPSGKPWIRHCITNNVVKFVGPNICADSEIDSVSIYLNRNTARNNEGHWLSFHNVLISLFNWVILLWKATCLYLLFQSHHGRHGIPDVQCRHSYLQYERQASAAENLFFSENKNKNRPSKSVS